MRLAGALFLAKSDTGGSLRGDVYKNRVILFYLGVSLDLVQHPKVVATPHLGASTIEAQLRVAAEISEQIVDAVNGKPMVGLVSCVLNTQ